MLVAATLATHAPVAHGDGAAPPGQGAGLSPSGIDPLRFGMDALQAEAALGTSIRVEHGINGCSFWRVPGLPPQGVQLIAFSGRLSYILLYRRDFATARGVMVGDSLRRLRRRYGGQLRRGRTASLSGAESFLFVDQRSGGATFTLEFDIWKKHVAFISAATKHVIETFGECA
jgi:hypothetical protein